MVPKGPCNLRNGVWGRAPVGCGAEPREENFAFWEPVLTLFSHRNYQQLSSAALSLPLLISYSCSGGSATIVVF